jgi:hypothetical protein
MLTGNLPVRFVNNPDQETCLARPRGRQAHPLGNTFGRDGATPREPLLTGTRQERCRART